MKRTNILGFTLAELLISLALLGIIATFTITKIISASSEAKEKAVFKEAVATISTLLYTGLQSGELTPVNQFQYFASRINAIKICDTNSETQLCWIVTSMGSVDESNKPGFVLASGAVLAGFDNSASMTSSSQSFFMDVNGTGGPNTPCLDQISIRFCFTNSCTLGGTAPRRRGAIGPHPSDGVCHINRFEELYQ